MVNFLFWFSILFILYTYAGYPIILWLATRFVEKPVYPDGELPSVSLLVPAYNEESVIQAKLENSLTLNYPKDKLQIIVVADGSDDRTVEIVQEFESKGVLLIYTPERKGKMAAINRAVEECRSEIIVFSDANNFYQTETLIHLVKPFQDSRVGTTTGAKQIIEEKRVISGSEGLYWKYESKIKEYESLLGSCITSVGEILAVRRELFRPAPSATINDDRFIVLDILKRGYKNIYVPEALSSEYASPKAGDEITRRKRISRGAYQVIFNPAMLPYKRPLEVWKILSHKYFRSFIPFVMIMALVTNLWLVFSPEGGGMREPLIQVFLLGQLSFYLVGVLGNFLKLPGKIGKLVYLPAFLINSNYALLAGFFAFFGDGEGHLWERVNRANQPVEQCQGEQRDEHS